MKHVLLVSPSSNLPTVVSTLSTNYPELMQAGYQHIRFGTKKELAEIEAEMLYEMYGEFELNEIN